MQNRIKTIFAILLGLFMVYGGVNHFMKPLIYLPFVPSILPYREMIVTLSGALEVLIGIGLLFPRFRKCSAFAVLALMVLFLPIHIWDIFRTNPAIGSHAAALIRVPIQFLFIAWASWIAFPCKKCIKTTR